MLILPENPCNGKQVDRGIGISKAVQQKSPYNETTAIGSNPIGSNPIGNWAICCSFVGKEKAESVHTAKLLRYSFLNSHLRTKGLKECGSKHNYLTKNKQTRITLWDSLDAVSPPCINKNLLWSKSFTHGIKSHCPEQQQFGNTIMCGIRNRISDAEIRAKGETTH